MKNYYFSEENLKNKSLSTLYRIRKAEKESEGTFCWYMYPCNIQFVLDKLIKEKLLKRKNE